MSVPTTWTRMPSQNGLSGIEGLGASSMWDSISRKWESTKGAVIGKVKMEAEKSATALGQKMAGPIVAEGQLQTKSYLPWIILGTVAVLAFGGFVGGTAARRK